MHRTRKRRSEGGQLRFGKKKVADENPVQDDIPSEPVQLEQKTVEITLSEEQANAAQDILEKKNVLVIAKAGSGKSSLAISAAHQYFTKYNERSLLITYNARLKEETRSRIKRMGLDHVIEAHSYHAAASKFFGHGQAADDSLIHTAINTPMPIVAIDFGLIIIDEAQDMNQLYANFVNHILRLNLRKPTMLIVGDPFQRIFGFNKSSCDFMVNPAAHFGLGQFTTHHLTICWRITHEMAKFINTHMNPCSLVHSVDPAWWKEHGEKIQAWWGDGIRANPARRPAPDSVKIVRGWGSREIIRETQRLFDMFGNDEVALLAYSLKGEKTPIHSIVDKMGRGSTENWAVLTGTSDSSTEILANKRLASTIHRMKGLERRGIVVCGMDAFIEKHFKDQPLDHFNVYYVACTRAKDRLIVNSTGTDYATIRCSPITSDRQKQTCDVSDLIKYIPFDDVLSVPENLFNARVEIEYPERALSLDRQTCVVEGRVAGTIEDLTPFMSRAITFRMMLILYGTLFHITVDEKVHDRDMVEFVHSFYKTLDVNVSWPDLVKYSVAYVTVQGRFKHLWRQLTDYDAFTPSVLLEKCTRNAFDLLWGLAELQHLVPCPVDNKIAALKALVEFEVPVALPFYPEWFVQSTVGQISGTAGIVFNRNIVVGIECSNNISTEKGLELSILSSMFSLLTNSPSTSVMILTNTAKLVSVPLKLQPLHEKVPVQYELIHRCARRKLQLDPANKTELYNDFVEIFTSNKPKKK